MTQPTTLAGVARRGAERAGRLLAARFRTTLDAEFGDDDVTTATDRAAEDACRAVIAQAYPDHAITGEEHGHTPGERVEWLIDPLDGTNNYAMGAPTFAVAVAARAAESGRPLAAVIHEPLAEETLVAASDAGAYRLTDVGGEDLPTQAGGEPASESGDGITPDSGGAFEAGDGDLFDPSGWSWPVGDRLEPSHDRPLSSSTVSFVIGIDVVRDAGRLAAAQTVREELEDHCKRTLSTWAPCVDWGLLARGGVAGIVCGDPNDREQVPGELIARETGLQCASHGSWFVAAHDDATLETLRDVLPVG